MSQPPIKGDWRNYLRDSWRNIPGEVTASGAAEPMEDPLLDLLRPVSDCGIIPARRNRSSISRRKRS